MVQQQERVVVQEKQGPYERSMMCSATAGEGGGATEEGAVQKEHDV